jgi:UV DNA damage repair endonuclease
MKRIIGTIITVIVTILTVFGAAGIITIMTAQREKEKTNEQFMKSIKGLNENIRELIELKKKEA